MILVSPLSARPDREKPGPGRVFPSTALNAAVAALATLVSAMAGGRSVSRLRLLLAVLLLLACAAAWPQPTAAASHGHATPAAGAPKNHAPAPRETGTARPGHTPASGALHGQPWAFGQSSDRKDALWQRGVPAQSLKRRAVRGVAPQPGRQRAARGDARNRTSSPPATVDRSGAMNTDSGIERALSDAEGGAASRSGQTQRAGLGMSMANETSTWCVTPGRDALRPDETRARDSRHVLRAFAGVEPNDDLSIHVGPELILKDEQHSAESAGASQPDSALGLGMQFKLDF